LWRFHVDPFKGDLYRYLNFDAISGFEDFGRVIPVDMMPKLEEVLV
jgi:aconitate hydratase 2/2-methylisocitrate dehydratase